MGGVGGYPAFPDHVVVELRIKTRHAHAIHDSLSLRVCCRSPTGNVKSAFSYCILYVLGDTGEPIALRYDLLQAILAETTYVRELHNPVVCMCVCSLRQGPHIGRASGLELQGEVVATGAIRIQNDIYVVHMQGCARAYDAIRCSDVEQQVAIVKPAMISS